jgi:Flp pilus assembly protein TadG
LGIVKLKTLLSKAHAGAERRGRTGTDRLVAVSSIRRMLASIPGLTLVRARRGVAAVEFALAMTPLLLIVFGFFAINIMFYTLSAMQNSAFYAASLLAAGKATTTNNNAVVSCAASPAHPSAEYYVCNSSMLPEWATFEVTSAEDCSVPKVSVTVSVNASAAALADVFSFFTGQTLTTTSVQMKQGSCP